MRCPDCNAENSSERRFCAECGRPLSGPCAACGFINPLDARFCGGCGVELAPGAGPKTHIANPSESGEIRPVVILFADICGFTKLSASLGAEATHALLGRFFEVVDEVVERYGGTIDKHIGDCAMAMFGAPVAHSDDPERAVRAALDIARVTRQIGRTLAPPSGEPLNVHLGIAAGQVVAGATGSERRSDYTVTGDSVNLAARLLDDAQPGEILVSEAVHHAVADRFECLPPRTISAKGYVGQVAAWPVIGIGNATAQPARPFVGRHAELQQLTGALETCLETGTGSVIYLRGDAGIGKTRLVERLRAVADERGFVSVTGLILDFGAGSGHDAIGAIVRGLIGATDADKEALRRAAEAALGELLAAERAVFLNDLLDLPQPPDLRSTYEAMDSTTRAVGRRETVVELMRRASRRRSLLLCVEDLHWAEPQTLAHLAALAGAVSDCPAILVMTTRSEGDPLDPAWRAATGPVSLTTIDLGPLRQAEASEMAAMLVDPSLSFAAVCIERAAGNPLFLEHLLRNAEQAAAEAVPASIQSVVLARVDRLPAADRRALQAASVLGQRFSHDTLRHLIGEPFYRCDTLIAQYLVRPEGDGFMFGHALVQEGVYASLLKARRTKLHRAAADWYRERDRVLYAEHLDRAGDAAAPEAYLDAAAGEMEAYRSERALELVERGLAIAEMRADRFALSCRRGELLQDLGVAGASIEAFEAAIEEAADDAERCRAWIGLAGSLRLVDEHDRALEILEEAAAAAEAPDLSTELARLCHLRGNLYFMLGNLQGCREQHARALELARAIGSPELEARAIGGLADASYAEGRLLTAYEQFRRCVALAQAGGFGRIEVANASMVPITRLLTNDLRGALEDALSAIALAQRVGHERAEMVASHSAHQALLLLGDLEGASVHTDRAHELALKLGSKRFEAESMAFRAEIFRAEGRLPEALALQRQALEITRGIGMSYQGPMILGGIAAMSDDPDERRAVLEEGEQLLAAGSLSHNHVYFYRDAIDACLRAADWDRAERYAAALEAYVAPEPLPWTNFLIERARALARHGRGERSASLRTALEQLYRTAETAGFRLMLPDLEAAIAQQ
jgi:class 3 adenylate cyclase/tetratricopeptide (TPR) repeat protein